MNLDRLGLRIALALAAFTLLVLYGIVANLHANRVELAAARTEADSLRVQAIRSLTYAELIARRAESLYHTTGLYLTARPAAKRGDLYGVGLGVVER